MKKKKSRKGTMGKLMRKSYSATTSHIQRTGILSLKISEKGKRYSGLKISYHIRREIFIMEARCGT